MGLTIRREVVEGDNLGEEVGYLDYRRFLDRVGRFRMVKGSWSVGGI